MKFPPSSEDSKISPAIPRVGRWHFRGYLPHFEQPGPVQIVTFRLSDSLPPGAFAYPKDAKLPTFQEQARRRKRLDTALDAGHGSCLLRDPKIAQIVERALLHFDGERYRMIAWVVMPSHAHVLFETLAKPAVSEVVQTWKSYTAKVINRTLGRSGSIWQPEYFDRVIRDERHFAEPAVSYPRESGQGWARVVSRAVAL